MTLTTHRAARVPAGGGRKSPLRTATMAALAGAAPEPTAADVLLAAGRGQREPVTAPELRRMQISEFAAWLRSRTNRHNRPFQEATVAAYADAFQQAGYRWLWGCQRQRAAMKIQRPAHPYDHRHCHHVHDIHAGKVHRQAARALPRLGQQYILKLIAHRRVHATGQRDYRARLTSAFTR